MNITVNEDRTVEKKYTENEGSQNENRITELTFTLPEAYTDFVHKIVFITEDGNYTDYIENNTYILKNNVTKYRKVKSYVWLTETSTNKDFRSELFELEFNYNEDPSDYIPTEEEKSQIELLMEELDEKIEEVTALEENVYTKTETNTLLEGKISTSQKGANNGVAELDSNGKVPSSQLPSYVDDIIEGYYYNSKFYSDSSHTIEITPENGKIYVDLSSNKTYRWSGTAYVEISESLALGETSSTAYRGDRGKIAYDHATDSNRVQTAQAKKFYKVGVTAEGHISEIEEVAKSDLTALGVEDTSNKVTELDASDTHYPSSNAVKKVIDALDDKIDENTEDIEELGNILYGKEELESTNSEISFTGNENLEFSITEIDGEAEQKSYEGYNELNLQDYTETINGVTITIKNGVIMLNGNSTNYTTKVIPQATTSQFNGEYNLNYEYVSGTTNNPANLNLYNGSQEIATLYFGNLSRNQSVTFNQDTISIRIYFHNNAEFNNYIIKPMLYKGAYDSTKTFEPFVGNSPSPNPSYPQDIEVVTGEQEVVVRGKNWLPNNSTTQTVNGITYTINEDKSITISGTATARADIYLFGGSSDTGNYLHIPRGSYVLNDRNKLTNGSLFLAFREKTAGTKYETTTSNTAMELLANQDCYFYGVMLAVESGVTLSQMTFYPMVSDEATTYEPYQTPQTYQLSLGEYEFAKIGNYADTIEYDVDEDKVYKNEKIGKAQLTSTSQTWSSGVTSINEKKRYYTDGFMNVIVKPSSVSVIGNVLCNYYKPQVASSQGSYGGKQGISVDAGGRIYINDDNYQDNLDGWKTWLDSVECYIYYALATPTKTEITGTLADQIKALYRLQQKMGTTIVEILGDLSPEFKIVYETDTISYIKDNFVKNTDYATSSKGGVILPGWYYFNVGNDGRPYADNRTYSDYTSADNKVFISKGTLENVLNARIGDINTMLDQMNREVV